MLDVDICLANSVSLQANLDTIYVPVVDISGYEDFRQDRNILQHGGVCICVTDGITFNILEGVQNDVAIFKLFGGNLERRCCFEVHVPYCCRSVPPGCCSIC